MSTTLEQEVEQVIRDAHNTSVRSDAWINAAKAAIQVILAKYGRVGEAVRELETADANH